MSKHIKSFAFSISKMELADLQKMELFNQAAHKKVYLKKLLNDILRDIKDFPKKYDDKNISELLSGLAYLGIELEKNDITNLNKALKEAYGGLTSLPADVLINFLFLVMQVPDQTIRKAIPEFDDYKEIVRNWSPKRLAITGHNGLKEYYSRKFVSDRLINKVKFQIDSIQFLSNEEENKNDTNTKLRRSRNPYEIMAKETRASEDTGYSNYANTMAQRTLKDAANTSQMNVQNYDGFELANELVVRQWAIMLECNILPKDKQLYTFCCTLLRRRIKELATPEFLSTSVKQLSSENMEFLYEGAFCPWTGWPLDFVTKWHTAQKKLTGRLLLQSDFYTEFSGDNLKDQKEKIMGYWTTINKQLEQIGKYEVKTYYQGLDGMQNVKVVNNTINGTI